MEINLIYSKNSSSSFFFFVLLINCVKKSIALLDKDGASDLIYTDINLITSVNLFYQILLIYNSIIFLENRNYAKDGLHPKYIYQDPIFHFVQDAVTFMSHSFMIRSIQRDILSSYLFTYCFFCSLTICRLYKPIECSYTK